LGAKNQQPDAMQDGHTRYRRHIRCSPEEDEECFVDTGKASTKTFMFPDKRTNKATKRMLMKHNLRPTAREMNIVPGLHSTLISVPKL